MPHTGRREIDGEFKGPIAADAIIAARDEDGGPTRTEDFELVTYSTHIFWREVLLSDSFRYQTNRMRVARLLGSVSEPQSNRVVSAWDHHPVAYGRRQRYTGDPVKGDRDRIRYGRCILGEQVCKEVAAALSPAVGCRLEGNGIVKSAGHKTVHES